MKEILKAPYWFHIGAPENFYPWLAADEHCDVLVIGAGIAGAYLANRFAADGNDVVLVSRSPVGSSAASYSSGIMEYDNGLSLIGLSKVIGKAAAVAVLRHYSQALKRVETLSGTFGTDVKFRVKNVLSFTSTAHYHDFFHTEYLIRRHNDFDVEYIDRSEARERFPFPIEDGILSDGLAATVDPYRFAQALVSQGIAQHGLRCYENTEVIGIDLSGEAPMVKTRTHRTIYPKRIIMATGISQNDYLHVLSGKRTAFTLVTEPLSTFPQNEEEFVVRGEEGSGFKIRTTPDRRLLITGADSVIGGLDESPFRAIASDRIADYRYRFLERVLKELCYACGRIVPAYQTSATYGCTSDQLPVIGTSPDYPNVFFCMDSGPENLLTADIAANFLLRIFHGELRGTGLFSPGRRGLNRPSLTKIGMRIGL